MLAELAACERAVQLVAAVLSNEVLRWREEIGDEIRWWESVR